MIVHRRRVVLVGGTIAGALIVVVLILHYGLDAVFRTLLHLQPLTIAVVTSMLVIGVLLNALSPVVLLGRGDPAGPARSSSLKVFLALQPVGLFAPGRISDVGALPLLKGRYAPGVVLSSILLDRLITLMFLLLLTPFAVHGAALDGDSWLLEIGAAFGLLVTASTPLILLNSRLRAFANRTILRPFRSGFSGFGSHLQTVLYESPRRIAANLGITAVKTIIAAAILTLLANELAVPLGFVTGLWMSVVVQLVTALPISAQGLGLAEGSLVTLFALSGFPAHTALSITLLSRVLLLLILGTIYLTISLPLMMKTSGSTPNPLDV